jgi:sugar lactone lactonase YvrE
VGTKSGVQTATVTITTAGTLSAIAVLTEGVINEDFQLGSYSCSPAAQLTVGQTCTIGYTFQPQIAGLRRGGISLNDSNGNPLGIAYIAGYGTGPQLATYAGSNGFGNQQLVVPGDNMGQFAVDGAGNIYYGYGPGSSTNAVLKATLNPDGSYTSTVIGYQSDGFVGLAATYLHGIALDGLGNIFYNNTYYDSAVGDWNCTIGKFTPVTGGYAQSDPIEYPGQEKCPVLFAVDGAGTIYYYDDGDVGIGYESFATGVYANSTIGGDGTAGYRGATDVAVDPEHNVYFADCDGDDGAPYTDDVEIFDLNPSTGTYGQIQGPWTPNVNNVPNDSGLQCGVTPDSTGGFWMSDASNTVIGSLMAPAIFHFTHNSGTFNYAIQEFSAPFGGIIGPIRIDSQGNIYFDNISGQGVQGIYKISASPPPITYPATTSGSVSAAQELIFINTGTSSLSLESASIPSFVANVSGDNINGYSDCSAGTTSLIPGGMCDYSTEFTPAADLNGLQSGTMNFVTNAYTPGYSIAFQGTANHPVPNVTSISPSSGASLGGTIVTINGTGLGNISAASFNSTPATSITQLSTTQVEIVAPAGTSGTTATITLTIPGGSGSSASGAWTWNTPPSLTASTFSLNENVIPQTDTTTISATIVSSAGVGIPNELVSFQSSNASTAASVQAMTNASGVATATITGLAVGSTTFTATVDGGSLTGSQVLTVTGAVPVGSTVTGQTAQVTITTAGTLSGIEILNKGMNGGDWSFTSSNCNLNASLSVGQVCNIVFSFTPTAPGLRQGAIELLAGAGSVLGETFLSDVGLGTQGLFSNGTQILIHGQSSEWVSVAVDDSGNMYGTQQVWFEGDAGELVSKITPAGTISTIATDINTNPNLTGIAVDGAGNVFYGDSNVNEIFELAGGVGTPVAIASVTTPGTGMATDGAGNIYVGAAQLAIKIDAITHATSSVGSVTGTVGGVAVDTNGDIFYTDSTKSEIHETPVGGTTGLVISTGVVNPKGITVDPAGDLYVAAPNAGSVYRLAAGTYAVSTVYNDPGNAYTSVVLDRFGNLYVAAPSAESGQETGNIFEITRNTASVAFPTTVANSTSATSLVPFENDGNQAMTVAGYSVTSQFGMASVTNGCTLGTLAVAGSCQMGLTFAPTASGTLTGSATLTESSGTTHTVALSGKATAASQTITFPALASSAVSGTQVTLAATASSGLPVTYSVTGPATLNGSVLTYTGEGTVVITASQSGNTTYTAAPPVQVSVLVMEEVGNTGAPGAAYTAAVTFAASGTLEQIGVLTQGSPNLDFQLAAGGTCTVGTAYTAGQSCSVNYTFAPSAPGERLGAIVPEDGAGNVLGTTYLGGIGNDPQALFTDGVSANVASGLNTVRGVSVDAAGNIYASEQTSDIVDKFAAGTGAKTVLATASDETTGTAVDGAGNVYFGVATTDAVYELAGGTGTSVKIASGWDPDNVLLVDGAGNLYSPDAGTGVIYEIAAGTRTVTTVLAGGQNHRFIGMAIDASGNLYSADYNSNTMYEVAAGSGTATQLFTGNGLSNPHGVAIDPAGNLYVTNATGDGNVQRYAAGTYAQTELPTGYASYGIAIDASGNLLTLDGLNIERYTRTATPPLSFSTTTVGATTAAQRTSIENDGDVPLTISSLATSSASFTLDPSTTTCSTTATLPVAGVTMWAQRSRRKRRAR